MDIRRKDEESRGTENQSDSQSNTNTAAQKTGGSGVLGTVFVIIILVALVAVGFYLARDNGGQQVQDGPVAIVNGQEIPGERLQDQLDSFRNSTSTQAQQFNDLSDRRQQEILLEGIINTELQLQAARGAGVTVSDEEVDTQLESSISQVGQEEFERRLTENNITREEVREDLRNQMLINAYIEQEAGGEITATDEEVQQLYDQYTSQVQQSAGSSADEPQPELPSLEQLRPQIEGAVIQQKQQEIALRLLNQARENADIEVLIEGVEYPATSAQQPTPTGAGTQQPATQPVTETDSEVDAAATTTTE